MDELEEGMHKEGVAVQILAKAVERALGNDVRIANHKARFANFAHVGHHETWGN